MKTFTGPQYTTDDKAWDELVLTTFKDPHYIQGSAWAESKKDSPWRPSRLLAHVAHGDFPIQVFSRAAPVFGRMHYAPEVVGVTAENLPDITLQLRDRYREGMLFKLELYQPYSEELIAAFQENGWVRGRSVQHRNTVIVDLKGTEEELFARIKGRARYEVRVAQRNGVHVEKVEATQENLDKLASLIDVTAERTGAFFRSHRYLNKYWHSFADAGQGSVYFAKHGDDIVAGAYVITYGKTAWYKDGGSVRQNAKLMGPRLLQWEIMRDLQSQGTKHYDLSGIPAKEDIEKSTLRGLYAFKTGFSEETTRFMPAMVLPFSRRAQLWPKVENNFLRLYAGIRKDFWY